MKYMITGGCGFLGSNLAEAVLKKNEPVIVLDNMSRVGSEQNLAFLKSIGLTRFVHGDTRSRDDVARVIHAEQPDVIFHLAGQVAMTTSIANPRLDFEINALGTLNVLEAIRLYSPHTAIIYSSSNKVYGDLEWTRYVETDTRFTTPEFPNGFPESAPLDFHSPYGCSKGTADQYILDYSRIYGINGIVFRHSTMYGGRQYATYDQGWIGWFCQKAVEIQTGTLTEPFTISGTGKQVRDVLHAQDLLALYFSAADRAKTVKGEAFNIGGGMAHSLSLLELFALLERECAITMHYTRLPARESDQRVFVADITKAQNRLGWSPKMSTESGIRAMLDWVRTVV